MSKKKDESYSEYRERVIDPISSSFCAAKWYNATVWLNSGSTTSCHHPPAHRIDVNEIAKNPKALHNTKHKKMTRKQMLAGERPPECEYCWKIEDMEKGAVSDRVFKTVIYSDDEIHKAVQMGSEVDADLITLEIAFDRTCNFACSYCNPSFSTTWAKDIASNGAYQNLVSDGGRAFQQDGKWAQPYKNDDDNPYIKAFWEWWPELSTSLSELRITGGEPLMSDQVWKLFDYFEEHGSGDLLFSINSNLGAKDGLIDRLIEKSHGVEKLDIYTSCEATGAQAEYIRDGLEYNRYCETVEKVISEGNIRAFHMMMTINSLSLFSITDFMDKMLEWKEKYGKHFPTWSVNILRFPSFMSPLALPEHIKQERHAHLSAWFEKAKHHPLMHEMEKDGISRLIDYIDVVKTPHRRTSSLESQHADFKSFFEQYDARRGKSFRDTFPPILVDWYDTLVPVEDTVVELVDGDATKSHDENPGQDAEGNAT